MGSPGGVGGTSDSTGSSGGGGSDSASGSSSGGSNGGGGVGSSGGGSGSSSDNNDQGSFADAMDAAVNDSIGGGRSSPSGGDDDDDANSSSTSGSGLNGPDNNFGFAGEFDGLGAPSVSVGPDDEDGASQPSLNGPENNFGFAGEFDGLGPTGAPGSIADATSSPETNNPANNFGYQDEFTGLTPTAPPAEQTPGPMIGFVGPVPTTPAPPTVAPPTTVPTAPPANLPTAPAPATPSLLGRALGWAARLSPLGAFAAVTLTPTNTQSTTTQINETTRLAHAPGDLYGRVETRREDGTWADTGVTAAPAYDATGNVVGLSNPSPNFNPADEFTGLPTPEIAPPTPATVEPPSPATVEPPTPPTVEPPEPATIEPGVAPEITAPTAPDATPPGIAAPTPDTPPDIDTTPPAPPPDIQPTAPPEIAPPPPSEVVPAIPPTIEPPSPSIVAPPEPARVEPAIPPQITVPGGPDATPPGVPAPTPAEPEVRPTFPGLPTPTIASDAPPAEPSADVEDADGVVDPAIQERYDELDQQGHGPARHGPGVTEQQLEDRALRGIDPMTGTTTDGVHGGTHQYSKDATRVDSVEGFVDAERTVRESDAFRDARDRAIAEGRDRFQVETPLEDIYGPDYQDQVTGVTREGTRNNPTGSAPTDFTDGTMIGRYRIDEETGDVQLNTMFPNPKN